MEFGPDGNLYASGGDGASFNFVDYGQDGSPLNPCGDPPGGVGATLSSPAAEGGALRSQDLRTSGDPVSLDGSMIRVDPATGAGAAGNPLATSADANARRVIAHGLRNPFRFTFRPGTSELWVGDVGWNDWEEINRIPNATDAAMENFGWPCYEGVGRQSGYDSANLNICENLYATNPVTSPYFAYYTRDCIWVMPKGTNGLPAPGQIKTFVAAAANPVNLETGPGGDLFYVDFDGGTIRRIRYFSANRPPVAVATASPTTGAAPLTVNFDGGGSSDPDGDILGYAWDLDGDGAYDDSTATRPTWTYTADGSYAVKLPVTDPGGLSGTATVTVAVGNTPPTATITAPPAGTTWKVGDLISFSGSATDPQDGPLPASALSWTLVQEHCHPTAMSTWSRPGPGSPRAHSTHLTTSTRRTWSCG